MRSEMRRPASPDIPQWVEAMDGYLARQVRQAPRKSRPRRRLAFFDGSSLIRPLTASAALAGAALVVAVGLAGTSPQTAEPLPRPEAVVRDETGPMTGETAQHRQVRELLTFDDAARLTASFDIPTPNRGLTGTPRSEAPAVPTPDGGGTVPTALRPTVS
ncbi:MAG TPA: hypothetical protein VHL52_02655 [Acidimicrobiia bacterium]|nr:hypothetical protein [Acidimicrobiia bacterium]